MVVQMLPVVLRASRQPAAWPLWRSPLADSDPMFPSLDTDLKAAWRQSEVAHADQFSSVSYLFKFCFFFCYCEYGKSCMTTF